MSQKMVNLLLAVFSPCIHSCAYLTNLIYEGHVLHGYLARDKTTSLGAELRPVHVFRSRPLLSLHGE